MECLFFCARFSVADCAAPCSERDFERATNWEQGSRFPVSWDGPDGKLGAETATVTVGHGAPTFTRSGIKAQAQAIPMECLSLCARFSVADGAAPSNTRDFERAEN